MLIHRQFGHCLDLGRDFIRAIQDVALINEFDTLWRDMLTHPQRLSPRFTGIEDQFMSRPTNTFILNSRLTPRMEIQLHYIMDGKPKHVGWTFLARFKKRYLSTPESELLIPDIIRYVCSIDFNREIAEHPRYLHRWEVIQNLMQSIKNELVAQNAKLALFYDWIYFTPSVDGFFRLGMFWIISYACRTSRANHGEWRLAQGNRMHHRDPFRILVLYRRRILATDA